MRNVRLIAEAWQKEWKRHTPGARAFTLSGGDDPSFYELHQTLLEAKDYKGLGLLHESIAGSALLLVHADPDLPLDALLVAISQLIKAAHWHRLGRDLQRSSLTAQRAEVELTALLKGQELVTRRTGKKPYDVWYVLEMLGDAAVCHDAAAARSCFEAARKAFAAMSRTDQMAEWSEYFPGQYHAYTARFIPLPQGKTRYHLDNGVSRTDYKLTYWLEPSDQVDPVRSRSTTVYDPDFAPR